MNSKNLSSNSLLLVLFIIISSLIYGQNDVKLDSLLKKYKLNQYIVDGIKVIVYKKNDIPKPTIIFISGSGFNPLFVNQDLIYYPFNFYNYGDNYNFVMLSKPSIPIYSDSTSNKYLNETFKNSYYLNNDGTVPSGFLKNNNCNFYTNEYLKVIEYLNCQKWVMKNNIILIGHSQGAHIAASIGTKTNSISHIILMSPGSIYNRFYESIRQIRINESYSMITPKAAQLKIDSIYVRYKDLLENKNDNVKLFDGTTYHSYYSFNFPTLKENITKLKQKTLVIYGTSSPQDLDCDYLNLELFKKNILNVRVIPIIGYDHNYFEDISDEKGNFIERKFHWQDVMDTTIKWITENKINLR